MGIFRKSASLDDKSRLFLLVALMVFVGVAMASMSIWTLYRASLNAERVRLSGVALAQANLLQSVARFDEQFSGEDHPEGAYAATMSQVLDAFEHYKGFGESGEFVLARRDGDRISFLASGRRDGSDPNHSVAWNSGLAEPMRRALAGESGTVTGPDYVGVIVLAAYEPVSSLNLGFVAKIDLAEVRKPFIEATIYSALGGAFILIVGALLFRFISAPFLLREEAEAALKASEARMSGILDLAMEAVVSVGEDQRIQMFSGGAEVIFGYTAEEAIGQSIKILLPERARASHHGHLAAFEHSTRARRMGSARSEIKGLRKDGSEFFAEASISRIEINGEKIFTATLRDLTSQKEIDEALRDSESSLANAQRIAHIGSWEWDIQSDQISWSDENFRIFELVPQELTPTYKIFMEYIHPDDRARVDAAVRNALENDQPYLVEHRIVLANGRIKELRERAEVYRDDLGKAVRMVGTVQDITEQKNAEDIARKEKAQAEQYLNIAGSLIMALDSDGRITLMNESACKILEYEAKEIVGKLWLKTFAPEEEFEQRSLWYKDWLEGGGQEVEANEVTVMTRTGKRLFTRWHNRPIRDAAGNAIGVLCSGEDITAQRQTELQLRQAQKMEAVGQLTSGIAHDFNNILAVVLGNLEFAVERSAAGKDDSKQLDLALQAAERGADLNRRLLAFSRNQVLESRQVNISEVIESMADLLERALGENIELVTNLSPNLPKILLDPAQLESAVLNLAINARDALPDGGVVGIMAAMADTAKHPGREGMICITFWDTGTGMTEQVRERAMEPFFTTKEVGQGSGLGLSMVYGFAEQSGGRMKIISEPDGGTIVEIRLPIDAAEYTGEDDAPVAGEVSPANGAYTILVVEDQVEVRDVVVANLEHLGYRIRVAVDGKAALGMLEQHEDIDLMLSDMVMPGMSGEEVVIAARAQYPDLHCVFMSGFAEKDSENGLSTSTEIRILRKPFTRTKLAQTLQECLADD